MWFVQFADARKSQDVKLCDSVRLGRIASLATSPQHHVVKSFALCILGALALSTEAGHALESVAGGAEAPKAAVDAIDAKVAVQAAASQAALVDLRAKYDDLLAKFNSANACGSQRAWYSGSACVFPAGGYQFGGMFDIAGGRSRPNPYTGGYSCPSGFYASLVSVFDDRGKFVHTLYYCYK